jgi:transposase InsO family protein
MRRRVSENVALRNQGILERIEKLKADHPFWGYRRVWAYLRFVDNLGVNKKRILRLMRRHNLLVTPHMRLKAKRTASQAKPRPTCPNQWWGIDMTKLMVEGCGWVYVVVVLDWYSKKIVGHYAGEEAKSFHWLEALDEAVKLQFPCGVNGSGLHLMSDNGSQPTSLSFMKACRDLGINQAFTSYNNPKGNADTERVIRTMKEELLWLREWTSPQELTRELNFWVEGYNQNYLHSTLGYKTPNWFEKNHYDTQITHLPAA